MTRGTAFVGARKVPLAMRLNERGSGRGRHRSGQSALAGRFTDKKLMGLICFVVAGMHSG